MLFEEEDYRVAFERFRRLDDRIVEAYLRCAGNELAPVGCLLDVGAGPGLQAKSLLEYLPHGWSLTALEPSRELLSAATKRLEVFGQRARCLAGDLYSFSSPEPFDIIWISEVVHLLGDPIAWAPRVASLLQAGGCAIIRTSTHEQLKRRGWYRHFPSALEVDISRHPSRDRLTSALQFAGLDVDIMTIDEGRPISSELYLSMMRRRAFSTLRLINDSDFAAGLRDLEADLSEEPQTEWDYEMTAYVAIKPRRVTDE